MSRKSRNVMNAETAVIRRYMEQNLPLGKGHNDIIKELGISRATYFRYVKRIQDEDAEIWDKVHMDSAKYRATQLMESLFTAVRVCKEIIEDKNTNPSDRILAVKTLCEAHANAFKIVSYGPTFRPSLSPDTIQRELTNNDTTKQIPT
jgi:hypothetical protein